MLGVLLGIILILWSAVGIYQMLSEGFLHGTFTIEGGISLLTSVVVFIVGTILISLSKVKKGK